MRSLWNDTEAAGFTTELDRRVYTSRLLAREPALVLHGGGNTSVKIREENIFGEQEDILYVKGSGWDLATFDRGGFAPCRMSHLLRLAQLPVLSDSRMADEVRGGLHSSRAAAPSVAG